MDRFKPKKIRGYIISYLREAVPSWIWKKLRPDFIASLSERDDIEYILSRVFYYNRITENFRMDGTALRLKDLWKVKSSSMYKHDAWRTSRWFDQDLKWKLDCGDVNWVCSSPSITKSRPICEENANNVILKLDRYRHFNFIEDPYSFQDKADKSIFMADIGDIGKMNRVEFMKMYFGSDICDCGSIRNLPGKVLPDEWLKPKMKIGEMLRYKFIIALEGNDVATSLKWIMSSQSLAVMPRPTCETWFMEKTLVPDYHYVEISPDYSDLGDKMAYYSAHPDKALEIIRNAHSYIRQFQDEEREGIIEYLVLLKYFRDSGQVPEEAFPYGEMYGRFRY